jgi:hypothetical protein
MTGPQLVALLKKNPISTVCGVLSFIIVVGIYFRSDALETAEQELKEKTALGERYAANLNYSSQLKEHYETMVTANKDIEDRFVLVTQLPQNLQYFYKLEADTGVKMTVNQNTQPTQAASGGKKVLTPVAFSVTVQGDYPSVVDFLRRVEEGVHFSRVLSATLGAAGVAGVDTGQARSISLSLNLELLGLQ